jgi:hypothetical protein
LPGALLLEKQMLSNALATEPSFPKAQASTKANATYEIGFERVKVFTKAKGKQDTRSTEFSLYVLNNT